MLEKNGSQNTLAVVVRLRLPPHAVGVLGALSVEDRSAVVLAGMAAMGLLPEEDEAKTPRSRRGAE